jgi:hypothetical protein
MFSNDEEDKNGKDKISKPREIRESYKKLMNCFSEEIGFVKPENDLSLGNIPNNIR